MVFNWYCPSIYWAWAPTGNVQSAFIKLRKLLSNWMQFSTSWSWIAANRFRTSSSSSRHSTAKAPCETAGINVWGSKNSKLREGDWSKYPIRFKPAAASTIASHSPSCNLRILESIFPRKGLNWRSLLRLWSWTWRRILLVPTTAPWGRVSSVIPSSLKIKQSLTSSRSGMAPMVHPSTRIEGTSFKLWIAISMSLSKSACSISLTKTPFPPMVWRETWTNRSPWVL